MENVSHQTDLARQSNSPSFWSNIWSILTNPKRLLKECSLSRQIYKSSLPKIKFLVPIQSNQFSLPTTQMSKQSPLTPSTAYKFKLVFLGDQSVGKTSIITRFMYDTFDTSYRATIGIDFLSKTIYLDDTTVRVCFHHHQLTLVTIMGYRGTGTFSKFNSIVYPRFFHCCNRLWCYKWGKFCIYLGRQSFVNINKWLDDVRQERDGEVVIMIVGNKTDLSEKREVSIEEAESKAKENGCLFIECSAKAGHNIKNLFNKVASALPILEQKESEPQETFVIPLSLETTSTSKTNETGGCSCWIKVFYFLYRKSL